MRERESECLSHVDGLRSEIERLLTSLILGFAIYNYRFISPVGANVRLNEEFAVPKHFQRVKIYELQNQDHKQFMRTNAINY